MERVGAKVAGSVVVLLALVSTAAFGALRVGGSEAEPQIMVETLVGRGDAVSLRIEGDGLEPGMEYLARLNSADTTVSASSGQLGRVVADDDGRIVLSATTAVIGAGAEVPLTTDLFSDGGRLVTLLSASGDEAASVHVELQR